MRQGVTIGLLADGTFSTLALPDRAVQEQRAAFKRMILDGGQAQVGGKPVRLLEVLYFEGAVKRKRFDAPAPASAPAAPATAQAPAAPATAQAPAEPANGRGRKKG